MYIKKTWRFKNTIEIEKMYSAKYGKKGYHPNAKSNKTPEAMMKYNRKKAVDKIRRLIKANFFDGYHVVLTYDKDNRPSVSEAERLFKNFRTRMKYQMKKRGYELKMLWVTEYEHKAIHHHVVINYMPGLDLLIGKQWSYGFPNFTLINDTDVQGLADYLIKETDKTFREENSVHKLRFSHTRNLIMPEPEIEIIKAKEFRKKPSKIKDYILDVDSVVNGVSNITGYEYQKYTLIKIQPRRRM